MALGWFQRRLVPSCAAVVIGGSDQTWSAEAHAQVLGDRRLADAEGGYQFVCVLAAGCTAPAALTRSGEESVTSGSHAC